MAYRFGDLLARVVENVGIKQRPMSNDRYLNHRGRKDCKKQAAETDEAG
jgi:hypothetical protein